MKGKNNDEMNRKERKPLKIEKMLSRRLFTLAFALWFMGMALLTWAVAEDMYHQVESQTREYSYYADSCRDPDIIPNDYPGAMEMEMIRNLGAPYNYIQLQQLLPIVYPQMPSEMSSDDWFWGKWDMVYGFEVAVVYYDEETETSFVSGNYLTFSYTDAEQWNAGSTEARGLAYISLDDADGGEKMREQLFVNTLPGMEWGTSYDGEYHLSHHTRRNYPTLIRLEGYFEGNEFHPVSIDSGSYFDIDTGDYVKRLDKLRTLDRQNKLEWNNMFTLDSPPDVPTETIYAWNLLGYFNDYEPVTVNGVTYDGLSEYLLERLNKGVLSRYGKGNLWESVVVWRGRHEDVYGRFYQTVAVRCWPLQYAILRMFPAYLVSFALVLLAVRLVLRRWKKCLVAPLSYLAVAAEDGRVHPSAPLDEVYRLETYVNDTHQKQAETQNEIQQLRTALDYAKNAEEKRRQMISNITHELKTPLAVIHSYAEGLQAGIAEEKQDQYLSVIRGEAENMDAMVLQMLDLSRLEAGKVRLAVDEFSLLELTQSVAEKLAPMMEAKGLSFNYGLAEDLRITADEGRIRQVVTNLISNALKYTAPGGRILVNVYAENRSARFTVINTADPLPDEALLKVWDSFYRVDPSRTEPGTGLGLTLVKNIVELHRGVCYVKNTTDKTAEPMEPAVEFGFTLPMRQ